MNYFDSPEVSNSDLGELLKLINAVEYDSDPQPHYDFGNLVDCMLTEPSNVDSYNLTCDNGKGELLQFERPTFSRAKKMVDFCQKDPLTKLIIDGMDPQFVVRNKDFPIEYEGISFTLDTRAKLDGIRKSIKTSVDYKSTAATSYKQFIAAILHFNYHRQGAWYMDNAETDRHLIIGISKKTNEVFKYVMDRSSEFYLNGKSQYQWLSYMWKSRIELF